MIVFLIPVLTCFDIILKYAVGSMDKEDLPRKLGTKIEIDRFHNQGFPFGKLKENRKVVKYIPVFITSMLLGTLSFLLPKKGHVMKKISLSLIIAGSLSNLFDRFTRGYVVDYLRIKVKGLDKVIFNLGDVYILFGSMMLPFFNRRKLAEGKDTLTVEDNNFGK